MVTRILFSFFLSHQLLHFHRLRARHALFLGVFWQLILNFLICPLFLAQKDFFRGPPPGWGAFRFDPVFLLIEALPLAVRPPFLLLHPLLMLQPFMAPFFFLLNSPSSY